MKPTALLIAFLLLAGTIATAQSRRNGLVVTGSVQKIGTKCINETPVAEIGVYITLHNESNSTLLLLSPSYAFKRQLRYLDGYAGVGGANESVSAETFSYNPRLDDPFGNATVEDYDPFPSFIKSLQTLDPETSSSILKIPPGGYYEFRDTIWTKTGFKITFRPPEPPRSLKFRVPPPPCNPTFPPVPEYRGFTLKYHLSIKKYDPSGDLLERLREMWKNVGLFVLDSDGDVSFESERIDFFSGK